MDFDIRDYGAIGDAKRLNTDSIQQAIDVCCEAGGGRVRVSDGVYMTGTITLKENVNLHIDETGTLLASPDCRDFAERDNVRHVVSDMLARHKNSCMIFAEECKNISITGRGTIDCNGGAFLRKVSDSWMPYERVSTETPSRVVFFTGCENVNVTDINMTNQPGGWTFWVHDCDWVSFDRVKVNACIDYPNNDGIHINSSRNVTVSNCIIRSGDDCLIIRANNSSLHENKVCEKVVVTNCTLISNCSGIRVGWIKDGTIRNCSFSNIVMTDTSIGISITLPGRGKERLADEGREHTFIENISFNNIMMDRIYVCPIDIKVEDNPETYCKGIQNIYFSNIHTRGLTVPYLKGRKDCRIKNIVFSDCSFEMAKINPEDDKRSKEVRIGHPNENSLVRNSIYMENTESVQFNNVVFSIK